jgi:hypothetical protein
MKYHKKSSNKMGTNKMGTNAMSTNKMGTNAIDTNIGGEIGNTLLLKEYIKALIQNVDDHNFPKEINLIFDGGVFNCGFAAGVAMYIKTLENNKRVKINQVSGCSAGAFVALWFLCGCDERCITYFEEIMEIFKNEVSFHHISSIITKAVNELFVSTSLGNLNNRLFINYYDTRKHKQKVVSKYKSKAHLIRCLLRTIHIPYIINGEPRCHNKYIDGLIPFIFKNHCDSLFIKLVTTKTWSRAFMLKSEKNIHYRLLAGVSDANDFFTNGWSDMCCLTSKRGYLDIFLLRGREISFIFMFSIIEWFFIFKKYIPSFIQQTLIYNGLINVIKGTVLDIASKILV